MTNARVPEVDGYVVTFVARFLARYPANNLTPRVHPTVFVVRERYFESGASPIAGGKSGTLQGLQPRVEYADKLTLLNY